MSLFDSLPGPNDSTIHRGPECLPLDVTPGDSGPLTAPQQRQLLWALLAVGVLTRMVRYLLKFPLWDDECFLMANLLDRGYLELTEPLKYHQVCPFLFLWIQATVVRLLGFSEYTVRLFPVMCSIGGLFLFRHVAGRLLRGTSLLLAVGIFAVGYPLIRYSSEAKPYCSDMFVALALLAMAVEWYRGRKAGWLWALTACVPLALGMSYPSMFAAGGISLALGYGLWVGRKQLAVATADHDRRESGVALDSQTTPRTTGYADWAAWACYNIVLLASFAFVYRLSVGPQSEVELAWMRDFWRPMLPPLDSFLGMVKWFVMTNTGEMFQYPVGGARGGSALTTVCCITAAVFLWRRGHRGLVVLLLAPLAPNLVAGLLWRYPYGGMRFAIYMAPAICLLAGLGAAALLVRRNKQGAVMGRPAVLVLVGLLATVAVGSMTRDFLKPYHVRDSADQRDFAKWFWCNKECDGEVICWESDLPEGINSPVPTTPMAAMYLCNRRIYSPRHASGKPVDWDRVSADRPLRLVCYGRPDTQTDASAFAEWLAAVQLRYDLASQQRHAFLAHYTKSEPLGHNYLDLYEFVPKGKRPAGVWASRTSAAPPTQFRR
ncbi:MAG TPA: hypothetical protein VJL29_14170 [Thermoguttaceae bacterium]|nr:hypothetical protein [Thermoguttaceae bacterium]